MHLKIHRSYRNVVAVCDSDLLGRKFEEGIKQLDIRESFYKNIEVNKEELIKLFQIQSAEDATFNIVGQESIAIAIEAGIITKENVGTVSEIPFALKLL